MPSTLTSPAEPMAVLPQPYLLFLGDITEFAYAKTAVGLRDWADNRCLGEFACPGATVSTVLSSKTPRCAQGSKQPCSGMAKPRSRVNSLRMLRKLGGMGTPGGTEKAKPWACPGPW